MDQHQNALHFGRTKFAKHESQIQHLTLQL